MNLDTCDILFYLDKCINLKDLEFFRLFFFGKKGYFNLKLKTLVNERSNVNSLNLTKKFIYKKFFLKKNIFVNHKLKVSSYKNFDSTHVFNDFRNVGTLHPLTKTINKVVNILSSLGFVFIDGPELEYSYYNFDSLNMPEDHPARDMHDTFYLKNIKKLLRTHTSNVQVRHYEKNNPPFSCFTYGKVYRYDLDNVHTPMFYQTEGFMVGDGVSLSSLKGILNVFLSTFFNKSLDVRFRPSYFPFTEPSYEVDISCFKCSKDLLSCTVCSGTGWLEVLGCGMIHYNILNNFYNSAQGFAFGIGIDRLCMIDYGITDIRMNFTNNINFLSQFK